jgi:DNA invertase Pin-like site-specific DNA recombinase
LHQCDVGACINVAHLHLGTHRDNMLEMWERRPPRRMRGEEHPRARLTSEQVKQIRGLLSRGESTLRIARNYGVARHAITAIRDAETWRHVR